MRWESLTNIPKETITTLPLLSNQEIYVGNKLTANYKNLFQASTYGLPMFTLTRTESDIIVPEEKELLRNLLFGKNLQEINTAYIKPKNITVSKKGQAQTCYDSAEASPTLNTALTNSFDTYIKKGVCIRDFLEQNALTKLKIDTTEFQKVLVDTCTEDNKVIITTNPKLTGNGAVMSNLLQRGVLKETLSGYFDLFEFRSIEIELKNAKELETCISLNFKDGIAVVPGKIKIGNTTLKICQNSDGSLVFSGSGNEYILNSKATVKIQKTSSTQNEWCFTGELKIYDVEYLQYEIGQTFLPTKGNQIFTPFKKFPIAGTSFYFQRSSPYFL